MPNPHDQDNESVIQRLRRLRDMLLGREPSKITEIDDEIDALTVALAQRLSVLEEEIAQNTAAITALTASQASQDEKLNAILLILAAPEPPNVDFTFQPPIQKEN